MFSMQCGVKLQTGSVSKLLTAGAEAAAQPEPFAREAKFLSESKALGRDVRVMLEGVDKFGNLFGQVCIFCIASGSKLVVACCIRALRHLCTAGLCLFEH